MDDATTTNAQEPAARAPGRRRLVVAGALTAVFFVIVAVTLAVKGSSGAAPAAGESAAAPSGNVGGIGGAGTAPSTTQPPDKLPDPGVGSGQCKMTTYTPIFAKEKQQGELCRPIGAQRDVAVIIVHGGAGISGTYAGMKPWSNRLNTEGYVTFAVDYHLFADGVDSPIFPLPEQNIKAAIQYVRGTANALGIRNDHVVVEGFSTGARLAAETFTTADDPYFAGSEIYPGISDEVNGLIAFYHPLDGSMQYQDQYYGGPESSLDPAVAKRWDLADSLSHASQATGPALFMTGENDWDIQITQMAQFVQTMQAIPQQAAIIVVPGGGHGFDQADGYRLSKLGESSATAALNFLNKAFPQTPDRPAQANPPDVVNAPDFTGAPPTSFAVRPQVTRPYSPANGNTPYPTLPKSSVPKKAPVIPPSSYVPPTSKYVPPTSAYVPPTSPPISVPPSSTPPSSPLSG